MAQQTENFTFLTSKLNLAREVIEDLAQEIRLVSQQYQVSPETIKKAEENALGHLKLIGILMQHFQWREKVLQAILKEEVPQVETNPTRCALGRWLTSVKMSDGGLKQILDRLVPAHDRLHQSVVGIQEDIRKARGREAALERLHNEIKPCFEEVLEHLRALIDFTRRAS
ncbi:CZB domain-containing protein [Thermosulfuriphilus sp.]